MPIAIIPLSDILTDPERPIDLAALPLAEAVERIKDIYGFLGTLVDVTIDDGMAIITLPEEKARQMERALARFEEADKHAAHGRYAQAIRLYKEGLEVLPAHTRARRDLAMAQMEERQTNAAKQNLIRVLQLDPKDARAYLILGNLYYQFEDDKGSAQRYYAVAADLAPDDPYILNAYGGLLAGRGRADEATALFRRAIAAKPDLPHARYGLALLLARGGDLDAALSTLNDLFAQPLAADPRNTPVYGEARRLYLDVRRQRAMASQPVTTERLRETLAAYTVESGIEVRLQENKSLGTESKIELAWRYQRPYHLIQYGASGPNLYLIANAFERIRMESAARAAGINRLFSVGPEQRANAVLQLEREVRKVQSRSTLDPQQLQRYLDSLLHGLPSQLYNMPRDCFIARRLYGSYPWLQDALFVGLAEEMVQSARTLALTEPGASVNVPPTILRCNLTMNAAYALCVDDIFGGATAYAAVYEPAGVLPAAQRLFALYQAAGTAPDADLDLVDAWAKDLGLTGWYAWQMDDTAMPPVRTPDPVRHRLPPTVRAKLEGGATNPDYFDDPGTQMAATLYMLDALRLFAQMEQQAILEVAKEIATIGTNGITYGDADAKYTLRSLPGQEFSGLGLLCMEYVGFKLTAPDLDLQIPLDEAYRMAVEMYESGM